MKLETVDDILLYYGGDKEGKEDDTEGKDVLPGSCKNKPD